jgi:uncharacterized protein (TIGR02147 family)
LYGFHGDYNKLARMVYPAVTPAQAKKSVELLVKLGLVIKRKDDGFSVVNTNVKSAPELISLAVHNYHSHNADMAKKALTALPRNRRNFTGVTLGISAITYEHVCKELSALRTRLLELADNDSNDGDEHGVYQLNLQLFSVSQPARLEKEIQKKIGRSALCE